MAVILRYFTELVYDVVVKQLHRFHNLLLKRSAQLFSDYFGKTN